MPDKGFNGSTAKETVKVNQNRANTFSARYRAITNKVRKKPGVFICMDILAGFVSGIFRGDIDRINEIFQFRISEYTTGLLDLRFSHKMKFS